LLIANKFNLERVEPGEYLYKENRKGHNSTIKAKNWPDDPSIFRKQNRYKLNSKDDPEDCYNNHQTIMGF